MTGNHLNLGKKLIKISAKCHLNVISNGISVQFKGFSYINALIEMKIDYSKHRVEKNLLHNSKDSDTQIFSHFEKLCIQSGSPVWKNEVISDNQMDAKPIEESQRISDEKQEKEFENSQQIHKLESQQTQNDVEEKQKELDKQEQSCTSESQSKPESLNARVQKLEEEFPQPPPLPQLDHKQRIIVKHSILGNKIPSHDPNVLVESTTFTSIGKIQPFLITISTNAALVMDYHCHLTTSEVCGYLAGNWDLNSHNLNVTDAFPCKCRLGDYESAPLIESEIRKTIKSNGLTLVGWYHSHPTAPATPSIRDIETQLDYQLRMKGSNDSTYLPCIGVICSPYNLDNPTFESNVVSYWVVPPPENKIHEYGRPMVMSYNVYQDQAISHDVLLEMKKCADFYKPENDYINFTEVIKGPVTFLEKLKMSVVPKFPLNHQKGDALWNYIQNITLPLSDKTETEILKQIIEISSTPSATPPPVEKSKFNILSIPPPMSPLSFKSANNNSPTCSPTPSYYKSHSRSKSSSSPSTGKRSSSRDKNLASLNNYFVGSDLAALFGSSKFPGMAGLDPATKSFLNLNSLSLGGMFLPPMAAAAAAAVTAASYKSDPGAGLMKPPPPPPNSYYSYPSSRNSSSLRTSTGSASRPHNRSIPSTSRDMPPPNKVPKLDVHQMANFFIPPNLGKNCTITNRPSTSTSSK